MIRNLLATTALATLIATAPLPRQDPAPRRQQRPPSHAAGRLDGPAAQSSKADGHLATNIIGESVYNGTGDDAENIGDVNDIVIGQGRQGRSRGDRRRRLPRHRREECRR